MINQNGRDAFEIYNDGVERILQEFGSCRRFLADLKKQIPVISLRINAAIFELLHVL